MLSGARCLTVAMGSKQEPLSQRIPLTSGIVVHGIGCVSPHCRHWQDLGYLIIYVTGRPDMQKQRVVAWLSQHNFPHGIVSFCDGLVHDPLRHKANFLKTLTEVRLGRGAGFQKYSNVCMCALDFICLFDWFQANMKIFAGYGSTKDISVYASIGLPPTQIYIVGRPSKKMQQQCQVPLIRNSQRKLYYRLTPMSFLPTHLMEYASINCFNSKKKTPLNSSSQRDMQLICHSWSTTTALGQPSPAAPAWCCVRAALAWALTATSWGRGTTCCAPSPPSQLPAPQLAASTTGRSARRANQTASGWSPLTATAREQRSAAWASRQAAGAAAAALKWNQAFSVQNEIRKTMH